MFDPKCGIGGIILLDFFIFILEAKQEMKLLSSRISSICLLELRSPRSLFLWKYAIFAASIKICILSGSLNLNSDNFYID